MDRDARVLCEMHSRSAPAPLPSWPHPCLAAPRPLSAEERPKKGLQDRTRRPLMLACLGSAAGWPASRCITAQCSPFGSCEGASAIRSTHAPTHHGCSTPAAAHRACRFGLHTCTPSRRWVGDDCKMNLVRRSGLHWLCAGSRPPAREPHLVLISRECEWIGEWPR